MDQTSDLILDFSDQKVDFLDKNLDFKTKNRIFRTKRPFTEFVDAFSRSVCGIYIFFWLSRVSRSSLPELSLLTVPVHGEYMIFGPPAKE